MFEVRKARVLTEEVLATEHRVLHRLLTLANSENTLLASLPENFNDSNKFRGGAAAMNAELSLRRELPFHLYTHLYSGDPVPLDYYSRIRTYSIARLTPADLTVCLQKSDSTLKVSLPHWHHHYSNYTYGMIIRSMDTSLAERIAKESYRKTLNIDPSNGQLKPTLISNNFSAQYGHLFHTRMLSAINAKGSLRGVFIGDEKHLNVLIGLLIGIAKTEAIGIFNDRALIHLAIHDIADLSGLKVADRLIVSHSEKYKSFREFVSDPATRLFFEVSRIALETSTTDPRTVSAVERIFEESLKKGRNFTIENIDKHLEEARRRALKEHLEEIATLQNPKDEESELSILISECRDCPKGSPWRSTQKLLHEANRVGITEEMLVNVIRDSGSYQSTAAWVAETAQSLKSAKPTSDSTNHNDNHTITNPKIEDWKIFVAVVSGKRVDHRFFESYYGYQSVKDSIARRISNMTYGYLNNSRAILENFRTTGVYELKLNSGIRILYGKTGEREYTVLGISTKEGQKAAANEAVALYRELIAQNSTDSKVSFHTTDPNLEFCEQ